MSGESVEIVLRAFDLWNRGDLAEWIALHHPEVVVVPPDGWPEGEQPSSRDEWLAQAIRLTDSWEEQRIEVERIVEADAGVLALFKWVTRGKGSHIDLTSDMACLASVGGGLITHWTFFTDQDEAVEAAGLRE